MGAEQLQGSSFPFLSFFFLLSLFSSFFPLFSPLSPLSQHTRNNRLHAHAAPWVPVPTAGAMAKPKPRPKTKPKSKDKHKAEEILESELPRLMRKKSGKCYRTRNFMDAIKKNPNAIVRTSKNIGGFEYCLGKDQDETELNRELAQTCKHMDAKSLETVRKEFLESVKTKGKKSFPCQSCKGHFDVPKMYLKLVCEKYGEECPV
jgi:hypothetical protein